MIIKSKLIEAHIFRRNESRIEFLVLKRATTEIYPGVWQMVTGLTEKDEKAIDTVIREIIEETSLIPKSVWIVPKVNSFYLESDNSINMVPVFLAEVDSRDIVKLSLEHSEYQWCNQEKAKQLFAWPGQRESVDIISECLTDEKSLLRLIKV